MKFILIMLLSTLGFSANSFAMKLEGLKCEVHFGDIDRDENQFDIYHLVIDSTASSISLSSDSGLAHGTLRRVQNTGKYITGTIVFKGSQRMNGTKVDFTFTTDAAVSGFGFESEGQIGRVRCHP